MMDAMDGESGNRISNSVSGEVFGPVVQAGVVTGGVHVYQRESTHRTSSTAIRLAQRPPWLARLSLQDGTRVAAGVLVDNRHVLTSVTAQGELSVEFPFAEKGMPHHAEIEDGLARLTEPVTFTPAPLSGTESQYGRRFLTHGFDETGPVPIAGVLGAGCGPDGDWVDLHPDTSDTPDLVGAPVFAPDFDAVTGIVAPTGTSVVPVSVLAGKWPWLAKKLGWRLDLDPALRTHWLPRARGSEADTDTGRFYFTGRVAARQAICDWLAAADPMQLVVGGPGTGKSALLAYVLVTADPLFGGTIPVSGPRAPVGSFDIAVHAKGLTRDDVLVRFATALGIDAAGQLDLIIAVREKYKGRTLTVLLDAVEEAASIEEARQIAALLRQLAGTGVVRVLAGVRTAAPGTARAGVLAAFGRSAARIDLESREFLRNHDVAEYVERRLHTEGPAARLRTIGRAVARKARYNFLVAQLATLWLARSGALPDTTSRAWEDRLPESVGQAMDAYLDACGPDPALVRRLLTALAFARGNGLSRAHLWLTVTSNLYPGHQHSRAELEATFDGAAHYLVERSDDTEPTYRLYHDALDEHLRETCPHRRPESAVLDALIATVPDGEWADSDLYLRTHIAAHAAEAGRLDELLADPGFLMHAEPGPLLAMLFNATTREGLAVAAIYRASSHRHRFAQPGPRLWTLIVDAARYGETEIQRRLTEAASISGMPSWQVRTATGFGVHKGMLAMLTSNRVQELAIADVDGRPTLVTASPMVTRAVEVWDLGEQRHLGEIVHSRLVATTEIDGRAVAVLGVGRGVGVWDLADLRMIRRSEAGYAMDVLAMAAGELDGRPIAVTSGSAEDRALLLWDLTNDPPSALVLAPDPGYVKAITLADIDGRPHVITGGELGVWTWDLTSEVLEPALLVPGEKVHAVAAGDEAGTPLLVVGFDDGAEVWDLRRRRRLGERFSSGWISSVAVAGPPGLVLIASTSGATAWRIGDLAPVRTQITRSASHVQAIATTTLDTRPVVVAAHEDGLRVWDLSQRPDGEQHDRQPREVITAIRLTQLNGRAVAVSAGNQMCPLALWDLEPSERQGRQFGTHGHNRVIAVTEMSGRTVVLSGGALNQTAQAWDLETGEEAFHWETRHTGRDRYTTDQYGVAAIAAARLGDRPICVTAGGDYDAHVLDLDSGELVCALPHDSFPHFLSTGQSLGRLVAVTATIKATVHRWDIQTGEPLGPPLQGHSDKATAFATGQSGHRLVAMIGGPDGTVAGWDITTGNPIGPALRHHNSRITALAVGESAGRLITVAGAEDGSVQLWDARTGKLEDLLWFSLGVGAIALGRRTAVVGFGVDIAVFDTDINITSVPALVPPAGRRRRWFRRQ